MNTTDPLEQLKDIQLPAPVGLWPLAWGWWVLLVVALTALGFILYRRYQVRLQNRYRLQAIAELQTIKQDYESRQDAAVYLQQINMLLRRCALRLLPRDEIAGLHGEQWLQQLDECCPACRQGFTAGPGRALLNGPYQPNPQIDAENLYRLALTWLQHHSLPAGTRSQKQEVQYHA
jgi:hypothetical protein